METGMDLDFIYFAATLITLLVVGSGYMFITEKTRKHI